MTNRQTYIVFCSFAVTAITIILIIMIAGLNEVKRNELEELTRWQKASCPVFKSECGYRNKYACERKADVVGRNQVGDIFVNAYPLCATK